MIRPILPKISLRMRLVLLTAFALFSLIAAMFIAWRLAQTTQTFAAYQAENQVTSAVRELAQEARLNPQGFTSTTNIETPPKKSKNLSRPLPPHIERILEIYNEPFTRLSAIALHRFAEVAGGFYRADTDDFFGYAPNDSALPNAIGNFSQGETLKNLARQSVGENKSLTQTASDGKETFLLAVEPLDENSNQISASFAVKRLPNFYGVSDLPNLAALVLLALATFGIIIFTFKTVRDLQTDTQNIQTDLLALESDLTNQIAAPRTPEFSRIVHAINLLAENLRQNLIKQKFLEKDLRRSEKLSALGRVASGVAHEIRNPLSAIKLKVQLAMRRNYNAAKLDETFQIVLSEIERLDSLVKRLLSFNKTSEMQFDEIDLSKLLQNRVEFFHELAAQQNIAVELTTETDNFKIEADAQRLTEVFDNLLQNALSAMPNGGEIQANMFRENKFISVKITDTGCGISELESEKIFEPFFTIRDNGTGLGLAIAREIVEAHHGEISFKSERGKGTTFFVKLPVNQG